MKYQHVIHVVLSVPALISGWFLLLLFTYYLATGFFSTSMSPLLNRNGLTPRQAWEWNVDVCFRLRSTGLDHQSYSVITFMARLKTGMVRLIIKSFSESRKVLNSSPKEMQERNRHNIGQQGACSRTLRSAESRRYVYKNLDSASMLL